MYQFVSKKLNIGFVINYKFKICIEFKEERSNKDEANAMADDLAFSVQISGDGTRVVSLDFCLSDIFGDGPASSACNRRQLDTFLKAVKAISKYLPE